MVAKTVAGPMNSAMAMLRRQREARGPQLSSVLWRLRGIVTAFRGKRRRTITVRWLSVQGSGSEVTRIAASADFEKI